MKKRLVPISVPDRRHWLTASLLAAAFVFTTILISPAGSPAQMFSWIIPGIALAILFSEFLSTGAGMRTVGRGLIIGAVFWALYWVQKMLFALMLAPPENHTSLSALGFVAVLIALLVRGYYQIRYHRFSPSGAQLYRFLFAAGYLDEWSTRLTLKIWPAKLPDVIRPRAAVTVSSTSGSGKSA